MPTSAERSPSPSMNPMDSEKQNITISISDLRAFIAYAAIDVLIAVGLYAVAPEGLGKILGIALALVLLPLPAVVLYFNRRRNILGR